MLTSTGRVLAYGNGQQGQLGVRVMDRTGRKKGLGVVSIGIHGVVSIAAGSYHSFAVTQNGNVYSWGLNTFGQTGVDVDDFGGEVCESL